MALLTACSAQPQPPKSAGLHHDIAKPKFPGLNQDIAKRMTGSPDEWAQPVYCGHLVRVELDKKKIQDGAPTYYDNTNGRVVAACDPPLGEYNIPPEKRVRCPPAGWTCKN